MTSRRIAFNILNSVINEGAYLHLALKEGLRGCDSNSAAFITALTHAAIENLKYSDYLLAHFVKGRMHGSIRLILRMEIAELLMMNTAPYAVIDESVVWYGNVDFFAFGRKDAEVLRFVNADVAGELLELSHENCEEQMMIEEM